MIENIKGKKLLFMGGIKPTCEIIKEAKSMGVETYVADYLENSPGKKIADHSFLVDATNVDAMVDLCQREEIDGVITTNVDLLLPYCQQVCESINKPFWGNAENIEVCINKEAFKIACEKSGVPIVPWIKVDKKNYQYVIGNVVPPVVIKPVDASGSKGVFKCSEKSRVGEYVEKALSYSKRGELLIEKAMNPQNEFSVYYIMNHGKIFFTGMGDRYIGILESDIAPIGQGMAFPSVHVEEWKEKVDPLIRRFFADNDMNDGFAFIQGFYDNGEFFVHEIGYRLNGGFSYKLIKHFSNYNQAQELIRFSLTGDMDYSEISKSNPFFDGCGMIVTITLKQGTISDVKGISEIEQLPGVLQFCQLHDVGDTLSAKGTTAQVFAYILCATDTSEEMKAVVEKIKAELVILDSNGNNLMNPIIDPQRVHFWNEM